MSDKVLDDFLSDENVTSNSSVINDDMIEDDIAAYDKFLASNGREQQQVSQADAAVAVPPMETLTTIPSSSQFSALSSSTSGSVDYARNLPNNASLAVPSGKDGRVGTKSYQEVALFSKATKPIPEHEDADYGDDFDDEEGVGAAGGDDYLDDDFVDEGLDEQDEVGGCCIFDFVAVVSLKKRACSQK